MKSVLKKLMHMLFLLAIPGFGQDHTHSDISKKEEKWTHRIVLMQSLRDSCNNMQEVKVDEMTIPGGSIDTIKHRHNAQLVGYILEGEVITKMKGKSPQTFKVGQAFYEFPNEVHEYLKNKIIFGSHLF